ncbi:MAG TPA: MATE family efflux transporter [Ruminococcaceae bacterium]|nr:MATE family efflux transporter [Oscillospiraceae bacterium]
MKHKKRELPDFGSTSIWKLIFRLAPPVMAAQLIQALYNIIDSFFIGRYSDTGLTALSIVYPLQLLMIALGVGTGVGINTAMSFFNGLHKKSHARDAAGMAAPLAVIMWVLFAAVFGALMPLYASLSTSSPAVIDDVVTYGRIVCVFSLGLFTESVWTKVLQAEGKMKLPMAAQILGAVVNIVLDPLLIFGFGAIPELGIAGAAVSTVAGQTVAALVVMFGGCRKPPKLKVFGKYTARIYHMGMPNILMQAAYTFYIFGLELILSGFSDQAVTVLGLYYKWQTFFFIPLGALQTCIVPVISYNYAQGSYDRCRSVLKDSFIAGALLMSLGTLCFEFLPAQLIAAFSSDPLVMSIGVTGFRIIGISFIPMVSSLIFPVFFQAVGSALKSSLLTVIRTVLLFVPLGLVFSLFGLDMFWLTYPVTEVLTSAVGFVFYSRFGKTRQNDRDTFH